MFIEHDIRTIVNSFVKSGLKRVSFTAGNIDYKKGTIDFRYEIERLSK